jgi:hypothetical protein
MGEFFTGGDIAHCHKNDLPLHSYIRIARVIAEDHGAFAGANFCFW